MRKINKKRFVEGLGSVLVIMPNKRYVAGSYQPQSIEEGLRQDWENIGQSFSNALKTYEAKVKEK